MKHSPQILILVVALLALPTMSKAQSFAPSAERGLELVAALDLGAEQEEKSQALFIRARKETIRVRAELEISSIDLTAELARDSPDEGRVAKLIDKMSVLEGQLRRSQVVTWIRVRKLLTAEQRKDLGRLRNVDGHNIVTTQGDFINPFQRIDAKPTGKRLGDPVKNPFFKPKAPNTKDSNARGGLSVSTSTPAKLYIDGKLRGVSPIALRVGVGTHVIRASFLDGSMPTSQTVEISKNRRTRLHIKASRWGKGLSPADMLD